MENREKIPARYRKNAQTASIVDALGLSGQQLAELVEDVKAQFFIDTATWGLKLWELQVGITPPYGAAYASRRAAIKDRLLAGGNTSEETIRLMATDMTGYPTRIVTNGDYSYTLELLGETDDLIEMDMSRLVAAIELIVPAHIRLSIAGLTWRSLEAVDMTWGTLEDEEMTWERLEASVPVVGIPV